MQDKNNTKIPDYWGAWFATCGTMLNTTKTICEAQERLFGPQIKIANDIARSYWLMWMRI